MIYDNVRHIASYTA